ncbi:MAG: tryptophan--tRNA ligase [Candidatus Paceibacterota bacterium]|jgi:tryptophanyl-tRNA synthetase
MTQQTTAKKILLSGVKPTGRPHIGNYFGAMKQFVDLLDSGSYHCYFMIVDYHALNLIQDKKVMSELIINLAVDYLAIGLDPKKCTIFKQSDVSVHTELTWIFDTIVTMPYLMRAHAYKDAEAKNKELNVGTFNYPVLMAADILLYDADVVPVGQDQKQHVEYARDIALKFNHIFKESVFKLPEDLIIKEVAVVPGTDGRKMSKSYGNTIPLFATDEEIKKAVMSIPTDSRKPEEPKNPDELVVYQIHKLFLSPEQDVEIRAKYEKGGMGYKEAKDMLIKTISEFITPLRERREKLAQDIPAVLKILKEGGDAARTIAEAKMEKVREAVGVKLY